MYHTQICANEEVKNLGNVLRVVIIKPLCNTTGGKVPGFLLMFRRLRLKHQSQTQTLKPDKYCCWEIHTKGELIVTQEQKRKDAYSSCILWRLHLTVDPVLRQTTCPFCMKNASFAVESMDTPTGFLLQTTEMGWIKMFART